MYVKENLLRNIVKMIIKKITKITLIGTDNTSMILFEYVQKILGALLFRGGGCHRVACILDLVIFQTSFNMGGQ